MHFNFDTFIHHLIFNVQFSRSHKNMRQNSDTPVTLQPVLIALKLGVNAMSFIVLIRFLMFLSISIRFGFSDVTLIFSGRLCTHVTSQKNHGKIFSIKSTQFKDISPSLFITSIKNKLHFFKAIHWLISRKYSKIRVINI